MKDENYLSIDIETDGPIPGLNSMLSLGAVIIYADGSEGPMWTCNFKPLPWADPNPDTLLWWGKQPEAWQAATGNQEDFAVATQNFRRWLDGKMPPRLIAAAWPATFDFAFINYYLHSFTGGNPLGFACIDLRSLIWGLQRSRGYYTMAEKDINNLAAETTPGLRSHVALDDAREQGQLLAAVLRRLRDE